MYHFSLQTIVLDHLTCLRTCLYRCEEYKKKQAEMTRTVKDHLCDFCDVGFSQVAQQTLFEKKKNLALFCFTYLFNSRRF